VTSRYTLEAKDVIATIKHKALRQLYEKNDRSGIRPDLVDKAQKVLSALKRRAARKILPCPSFDFTR
jgi:hypothetical protein